MGTHGWINQRSHQQTQTRFHHFLAITFFFASLAVTDLRIGQIGHDLGPIGGGTGGRILFLGGLAHPLFNCAFCLNQFK